MGKWSVAHPRKVVVDCSCAVCGKSFSTPGWRAAQGKGKYCSQACRALGIRADSGVTVDGRWFSRTGRNKYFWCKQDGKSISLHRYVWEKHNGPIPEGHAIHHVDGDPGNNAIENLECLPRGDHQRAHMRERHARGELKITAAARDAAAAWHKSDEGREWHRAHAPKSAARADYVCAVCGTTYRRIKREYKRNNCSPACYQKQLRRERRGLQPDGRENA